MVLLFRAKPQDPVEDLLKELKDECILLLTTFEMQGPIL
jgi:hypothetical protein